VMAIRSERSSIIGAGFAGNPALLATVVLTITLQMMLVYVPTLNALFRTAPLKPAELAVCAGAAVSILAIVECEKWFRRQQENRKRQAMHGPAFIALK
jgi:Ca2+-transporting ATPase